MSDVDRALRAIAARRDGVWDNEDLVAFGPLSPDVEDDVHGIKVACLRLYGFVVGPRDPLINRHYRGAWMVAEAHEPSELPTDDGSNGPWCVVGDDLHQMVDDAFDFLAGSQPDKLER